MLLTIKHKWLFFLLFLFIDIVSLKAQQIEVKITDIRSSEGQIIIGIYKNEESFKDDIPFMRKKYGKNELSNGEIIINLSLDPGTYGFAFLDDENSDDDMNYNFIGIPKEGFGFSNYYHTNLSRPKFDVFKFEIKNDLNNEIVCKMKYM